MRHQLGRQEISLGGQRLVGAVDWAQQGRAFDAVRFGIGPPSARLHLVGALLNDATAPAIDANAYFAGAYAEVRRVGPATLDVYGFFNGLEGPERTREYTVGARWWGATGLVRFRAEGSMQFGDRRGMDVRAFMVGGRVGVSWANSTGSTTLWYDYLSGGDDPVGGTLRTFDTLFGTNHKYYGLADFFTNIPVHTRGRGLQDAALKSAFTPTPRVKLGLEFHSFHLANASGLATGHLGEEIDLTIAYSLTTAVRIVGGGSWMFTAEGFREIGRVTENANWLYTLVDVTF